MGRALVRREVPRVREGRRAEGERRRRVETHVPKGLWLVWHATRDPENTPGEGPSLMLRIIDMTDATSSAYGIQPEFSFAVWDTVRDRFMVDEHGDQCWTWSEWLEENPLPHYRERVHNLAEPHHREFQRKDQR